MNSSLYPPASCTKAAASTADAPAPMTATVLPRNWLYSDISNVCRMQSGGRFRNTSGTLASSERPVQTTTLRECTTSPDDKAKSNPPELKVTFVTKVCCTSGTNIFCISSPYAAKLCIVHGSKCSIPCCLHQSGNEKPDFGTEMFVAK